MTSNNPSTPNPSANQRQPLEQKPGSPDAPTAANSDKSSADKSSSNKSSDQSSSNKSAA